MAEVIQRQEEDEPRSRRKTSATSEEDYGDLCARGGVRARPGDLASALEEEDEGNVRLSRRRGQRGNADEARRTRCKLRS
mmetsp:Transcript_30712/g.65269  ORF Transcript_30712/g.65269 Transcript_30712/m.65269 type:complete len:80 (+) Transcript_30712:214-453(+)